MCEWNLEILFSVAIHGADSKRSGSSNATNA